MKNIVGTEWIHEKIKNKTQIEKEEIWRIVNELKEGVCQHKHVVALMGNPKLMCTDCEELI